MLAVRWSQEGARPASELPASWQMYSSVPAAHYAGIDRLGQSRPLTVDALPPVLRAVDVGALIPSRLCARDRRLAVVIRTGGPQPGRFPC